MGHRALVWGLCAAIACRPPAAPVRPAPPVVTMKRYAPLEMRADAKSPGQAVILGTDDSDASTVLPLPATGSANVVDVPLHRGLLAVRLLTSPNLPEQAGAPVGSSAPELGALSVATSSDASAAWRAQLWSAVMAAASALGKDVGDIAWSAAPPVPAVRGERTAASALVTAGFLAVLTGEDIDRAATLVGVVYPDGTLGPSAGLSEQIAEAIARGKQRVGVPIGVRKDTVERAKDRGAATVELATVQDAYRLLTGAPLPTTVPVSEAEMVLEQDTLAELGAAYLGWRKRIADEWAELLQLEQVGRLPSAVTQLVRFAKQRSEQAEALHRSGQLAAAYSRILAAWIYAAAANETHKVLDRVAAGDVDGAVAALPTPGAGDDRTAAVLAKLGALRPSTLPGHVAMVAGFQAALRGASYQTYAAGAMRAAVELLAALKGKPVNELGGPATADAVANAVVPGALLVFRAIAETAAAEQGLEGPIDRGAPYTGSPASLARLAAELAAAGAAELAQVDGELAADEEARRQLAIREPAYLVASIASRVGLDGVTRELATAWGDGSTSASLLRLAGHALVWQHTALIQVKQDAAPALRGLIANARRAARAWARAARIASGAIPVQAKLAYHIATIEETGGVADQLDALGSLWTASMLSQITVMLARN